MDELQLRMKVPKVTIVADAIDDLLDQQPDHADATELSGIAAWLRYRVTRATAPPPAPPAD
jgi:hypothetical protein